MDVSFSQKVGGHGQYLRESVISAWRDCWDVTAHRRGSMANHLIAGSTVIGALRPSTGFLCFGRQIDAVRCFPVEMPSGVDYGRTASQTVSGV